MKLLLCILFLLNIAGHALAAEEGNNPETKPESDISSSTKKALRKVGRRARDESCEWTENKAKCEQEKAEHKKGNLSDEIDTKKRALDKAQKEYQEALDKK